MASLLSIILAAAHIHQTVAKPDLSGCFDLQNEENNISILENEAFKLAILMDLLSPDEAGSFTFQCKNSVEIITTDQRQQIHLNGFYLWFLPASLTDSESYRCFLWNTSYCVMEVFHIQVLRLSHGQCYHENLLELPQKESPSSIHIYCPELEGYFQSFSVLQWFKDCNPITIDNKKYFNNGAKLLINDANSEDNGMYTCKLEYEHLGKKYNVTRTTELKMKTTITKTIQPEVRNPKNNTIEARLGSELNVTCEALVGFGKVNMILLTWKMNNADIPEDEFRIKQGDQSDKKEANHATIALRNLIISKIVEEDFQTTFECFAYSPQGNSYGFLKIAPQPPDWTLHVIMIFVPLIFVILAGIIMYLIFKVDIILWYREMFESHKPINDGKMFDAYVSYPRSESKGSLDNYDTNHFALHILPRTLEEKYGYKLFIPGRDELPGQVEVEVIEEHIRNSRRLIIVLAQKPSANDQAYSGFEHEIGLFEALIWNEMEVILIKLEQGEYLNDIPESIRHVIQKNGIIKWKPDRRNKPEKYYSRFWKQVRYKMPVRSKSSKSTVYDSQNKTGAV
ncbi:interleukin-1 receptor type 1-like [Cetorhinus maximus]